MRMYNGYCVCFAYTLKKRLSNVYYKIQYVSWWIFQGEAISTFQLGNNLRRKNRTTIYSISHNGSVLDWQTNVQNCTTEYFKNLYETKLNEI
jgi:hypothetical protein